MHFTQLLLLLGSLLFGAIGGILTRTYFETQSLSRRVTGLWGSGFTPKRRLKINRFIVSVAGMLFGSTLATGLGLNRFASLAVGLIVGLGVSLANSLVTYLLAQSLGLAFLGVVSYVLIRTVPGFQVEASYVFVVYLLVVGLSPMLFLIGKVRSAFASLRARPMTQLFAVGLFTLLVRHLRQSRPSDADYALSVMYSAEDNAGIVAILSQSLRDGVSPHTSLFGEFMNGIYLTGSFLIKAFGQSSANDFLPALTHWNITTLFLAWAPIAALVVLALSGKKFLRASEFLLVGLTSAIFILLFWPFVPLGHTSVVSSGLFAAGLLSITLNRRWARRNPFLYVSVSSALAFIVATTWFPLMPLAAATTAGIFLAVVFSSNKQQIRRISIFLTVGFSVLALILLPEVLKRVQDSSAYLQMAGGTRSASELLILLWLAVSGIVFSRYSKTLRGVLNVGNSLFVGVVVLLLASNVAIYINGLANNSLTPGYGASKYIMVSVALSLPVLFILISHTRVDKGRLVRVIGSGLIFVFAILFVQPDSRATAVSFVSPAPVVNFDNSRVGVFKAIKIALSRKPDHVLCVSDYGFPYYGDVSMDSYFCTRWAQSLLGNEGGSEWRFVPLGRIPQESLVPVVDAFKEKKVVVLRLSKSDMPLLKQDTWWIPYVDKSWEILPVR